MNDGAAVLLITNEYEAKKLGIKPLAKILAHASVAHEPERFTSAPGKAIKKVLSKTNLSIDSIDLWEVNELCSCYNAVIEILEFLQKKNVVGAVAIGHPMGASGARI